VLEKISFLDIIEGKKPMKVYIGRNLLAGQFTVQVSVSEFTLEEKKRIEKFGAPLINFTPRLINYRGQYKYDIPLNDINFAFGFNSEAEATQFATTIKERISGAVIAWKAKKDNFSDDETLTL
jgi:hypothetical protein